MIRGVMIRAFMFIKLLGSGIYSDFALKKKEFFNLNLSMVD